METGNKWFKFYGQDWLTDLKIMRLSIEDRLCYVTLLCLASSSSEQGVIHDCDEEMLIQLSHIPFDSFNEYNPFESARGCLGRFKKFKMIEIGENGDVTINAFTKRQESALTGAERVARHREKLKRDTKRDNDGTARDTQRKRVYRERLKQGNSNEKVTEHVTKVTLEKNRVEKKRIDKSTNTSDVNVAGVQAVMEVFAGINPTLNWGNKTTRKAALDLIGKFGLEATVNMARQVCSVQGKPYAPVATTPYQLKEKLAQFKIYFESEKSKQSRDKPKIAIIS